MQTVGLIGGLSWESTARYYEIMNRAVRARMGGLHSAKILLYSFDFASIVHMQQQGHWEQATDTMIETAQRLETGGADVIAICTNTMHKMADAVQQSITVPLLHIGDATGSAIQQQGLKTVGLLGTCYTMEQDFLRNRIAGDDLQVLIPNAVGREIVHSVIFDELCQGVVCPGSRTRLLQVIDMMAQEGAEGIVLGCTELMLLLQPEDCALPLFDTTTLHAEALAAHALNCCA